MCRAVDVLKDVIEVCCICIDVLYRCIEIYGCALSAVDILYMYI